MFITDCYQCSTETCIITFVWCMELLSLKGVFVNIYIMEKTIRKLISNSIRLRAWTASSNYLAMNVAMQHTAYSSQFFPDVNIECKETKSSVESVNKLNPAGLNNVFIKDDTLKNNEHMRAQETFKIVKNLLNEIKLGDTSKEQSENLSILCKKLQKDANLLDINQIIMCLYVFKSLQVSFKSNVVQKLLQYIRISVNELSIKQMLSLYRVMAEENDVYLVKALKKAFINVFYNQMHVELNRHDMNSLKKALELSINLRTKKATQYIIDILSTNLNIIEIQHVKSIFPSLCSLPKLKKTSLKVLSKVEEVIMANPSDLSVKDINILLFYMMQTFVNGSRDFYNVKIVSALCNSVTSRNVSVSFRIKMLEKLNRMFYCDITLLDYITMECIKNHDCLKNCNPNEVFQLIKGYTYLNHKPSSLEILEPQLINYVMNRTYSLSSLVAIAFRLLSLGCYYPELYEKVFTSYYCANNDHRTYQIKSFMLKLHQALQYFHPEYNGMTLSLTMIDEIAEAQRIRNATVYTSLTENFKDIIGDVKYIKLNMRTKFGYFIDCAAVLQSDGSLMAINQDNNNNIEFVEDLMLPPGCRKLIISVLPRSTYTYNMQNLHSTWKLHLKIMEASLGVNIYHLNPYLLEQMSFREKNRYIRQVIGLN